MVTCCAFLFFSFQKLFSCVHFCNNEMKLSNTREHQGASVTWRQYSGGILTRCSESNALGWLNFSPYFLNRVQPPFEGNSCQLVVSVLLSSGPYPQFVTVGEGRNANQLMSTKPCFLSEFHLHQKPAGSWPLLPQIWISTWISIWKTRHFLEAETINFSSFFIYWQSFVRYW